MDNECLKDAWTVDMKGREQDIEEDEYVCGCKKNDTVGTTTQAKLSPCGFVYENDSSKVNFISMENENG